MRRETTLNLPSYYQYQQSSSPVKIEEIEPLVESTEIFPILASPSRSSEELLKDIDKPNQQTESIPFPSSIKPYQTNRSLYHSLTSPFSSSSSLNSIMHRDNPKCYVCSTTYPSRSEELLDDQQTAVYYPHRIGRSILICGKKSSSFPYQLFVGPDWPCMCITYCLLIGPTALFINNIGRHYGPGIIFLTIFLLLITLWFYSYTACSDPGVVFVSIDREDVELGLKTTEVLSLSSHSNQRAVQPDRPNNEEGIKSDEKDGGEQKIVNGTARISDNRRAAHISDATSTIECGLCHIQRPRNAYHCHDCGVCVVELDHHCPWTGKCIGKKTIKTFYGFLWSLTILVGYVILMVVITAVRGSPIFDTS